MFYIHRRLINRFMKSSPPTKGFIENPSIKSLITDILSTEGLSIESFRRSERLKGLLSMEYLKIEVYMNDLFTDGLIKVSLGLEKVPRNIFYIWNGPLPSEGRFVGKKEV